MVAQKSILENLFKFVSIKNYKFTALEAEERHLLTTSVGNMDDVKRVPWLYVLESWTEAPANTSTCLGSSDPPEILAF